MLRENTGNTEGSTRQGGLALLDGRVRFNPLTSQL